MSALLPVITAIVADKAERGYLAMVAHTGEVVDLPLEMAPIDGSPHALEIRVEGDSEEEPLVVMAEPMGAPTKKGFPLRLFPLDDKNAAALKQGLFGAPEMPREPTLGGVRRSGAVLPVSADHAASLTRTGNTSARLRAPGALKGRSIGGDRFVLENLLGGGAAGEVYRARHTTLRRPVAVKVLHPSLQYDPDYCTRFYGEALAASRLDHVNVLRVLDYGQEPDGLLYIAMELLEGKDLLTILEAEGPLPVPRIVALIAQACAGLAHAHDAGVIHRDIKPENIVVVMRRDDDGQEQPLVKVCDFGIAHWEAPVPAELGDNDRTLVKRPDNTVIVGTPLYMAPEQIRNEPVDARTDVYALGVVLYELATGRAPFMSQRQDEVLMGHLLKAPPPPSRFKSDLDPMFERIIMRALSKDPRGRPPDARTLRAELKTVLEKTSDGRPSKTSVPNISPSMMPPMLDPSPAVQTAEAQRLAQLPQIAAALRTAIADGKAKAARETILWLQGRLKDPEARDLELEMVERALSGVRDPAAIASLMTKSLQAPSGDKTGRDADLHFLLRAAGPIAARALVEARRRRAHTLDGRARFAELARAIGQAALPVLIETLGAVSALATRADEELAEDLLASIPETPSDVGGEMTVRFVRADKPVIAARALRVTAALWGARAQSLLLGVLDSPIEELQMVAIEMLESRGKVDDWAIERLVRIVSSPGVSDALKTRAAVAFAYTAPESRKNAFGYLQQRLSQNQKLVSSMLSAFGGRENPAITLALARSIAKIDSAAARPVLERLSLARADLRQGLESLLSS